MSELHEFIWAMIGMFNMVWFVCMVLFVRYTIISPKVGQLVMEMIQNGDGKGQHEDGNKSVILLSAIIILWLFINSIFAGFLDGISGIWYTVWGIEATLLLGLLGLKKLTA